MGYPRWDTAVIKQLVYENTRLRMFNSRQCLLVILCTLDSLHS